MQNEKTNTTAATKSSLPSKKPSVFDSLKDQEVRKLITEKGIFVRGGKEDWSMNGNSGTSGYVQILQMKSEDSDRLRLTDIKVREEQFGIIDILNNSKELQQIELSCEITTFGNKSSTYLTADQPSMKLA